MAEPPSGAIHPATRAEWRAWLAAHGDRADGVWVVRYKQGAGRPTLSVRDLVEEALCAGWIDSLPRALDAERTMLYVAPRKAGSGWSRLNKTYVAALAAAGQMTPAGQAVVDAAQADGSWTALDAVERLEVPDDLAAAFSRHPGATEHWTDFPRSAKRGILEWIHTAKRGETRQRRVDETARLAQRNERANQWPRR